MKKKICFIITVLSVMTGSIIPTHAAVAIKLNKENKVQSHSTDTIDRAIGVTEDMTSPEFWKNKLGEDADRVLMTIDEIEELNKAMLAKDETNMHDLENMNDIYYAIPELGNIPEKELYINGKKIDNQEYFGKIQNAISKTAYKGRKKIKYAVITKRADLKEWPTKDIVGYSPDDTDDELQGSGVNVNEPFVIKQHCIIDGEEYYMGYTTNCVGWIPAECVAVCASKAEWLDAWKVDPTKKDFIVITQDKLSLEASTYIPEISEVKLNLGTILKLVPNEEKPRMVGERGTWYNYTVYLPTRDKDGKYVRKEALISQHYNVSVGYRPLTQANIIDTAFTCLGSRYGWGGMVDSMDCSAYTRYIYRCFGLEIPRNTTWQVQIPDHVTDISKMSDDEKLNAIKDIPAGSLLMFKGHITMYLGMENDMAYVISDTGTVVEREGNLTPLGVMSVIINPLDVRRTDGTTWLNKMLYAVNFDSKK